MQLSSYCLFIIILSIILSIADIHKAINNYVHHKYSCSIIVIALYLWLCPPYYIITMISWPCLFSMYNEFYDVDNVCMIYWLEFKASIYISLLMLCLLTFIVIGKSPLLAICSLSTVTIRYSISMSAWFMDLSW